MLPLALVEVCLRGWRARGCRSATYLAVGMTARVTLALVTMCVTAPGGHNGRRLIPSIEGPSFNCRPCNCSSCSAIARQL